jgi:hypothetical protein
MRDRGVVLGLYRDRYLRHEGPEHVLAVAPTRSGKGVGLVLPTLLTWPGSAVIHDIKGENWELTAGWRARFSHCLLFDPTNPASARFNPLLEVRKGPNEVRDVQNIADILVDPEGTRDRRDHWDKTAHTLLTGAILHVLYAEGEKTLARVATFLADPSRSIVRTLRIMLTTNHLGTEDAPMVHPAVASIARELLNKSENERSGVVSTAMSLLALYRDPLIAANTAASDWRIADLMDAECPVSLYLVVPPSDISRTRPLVRLILNQIARRLTETLPHGHPRRHRRLRPRALRSWPRGRPGLRSAAARGRFCGCDHCGPRRHRNRRRPPRRRCCAHDGTRRHGEHPGRGIAHGQSRCSLRRRRSRRRGAHAHHGSNVAHDRVGDCTCPRCLPPRRGTGLPRYRCAASGGHTRSGRRSGWGYATGRRTGMGAQPRAPAAPDPGGPGCGGCHA